MQALNEKAEAIFHKLTEGMVKVGDHRKWDNASGTFMAVCIEVIGRTGLGPLVSVAHYYEQNGDAMRDPDVVMIDAPGGLFPVSYRQDGLGINQDSVTYDENDGHINGVRVKMQVDIASFCGTWARNLKDKQGL